MNPITKALAWIQASAMWLAACLALSALAWLHGCQAGMERQKRAEAAAAARALEKALGGAEAAGTAVAGTRSKVENQNERARDAASKSDDPLGDGLRELRR